ncbi:4Fe-4S single cluster domain-containing protein [Burkholderia ubonensis]|uniref:4Fe-4S single cluster domain-containing protein n=1 Tax=Burkholderia ubonensis TaxID=101571 RepID=UPI00075D10EF|nr:4Fe-4S single cluster domain-containing protein [Burkholderia ubonensis]KVL76364.1 radical SAM protein [Burkholderia ubonensis]KVL80926.1 radical SAM protein [Burkholderia ubonensis]KVL96358.1 radical SAM protein [Burkholderia ubonensis]KVM54648.1 radical SAM protein [Burkholderia ubonensis]KVQ99200.1 radical SAM protein [Burkholderia ubonensis]
MDIRISRLHFPVTTLGPGRRIGIWFQGCTIRCPGCISMDTWASAGGETTIDAVLAQVRTWLPEADGITISGGEPFDQPEALIALLRGLRRLSADDVLVYSGHAIESLADTLARADGLIDALISDPFDIAAAQTRPLRGSDNQRLHCLTAIGRARFAQYEHASSSSGKTLDVMFDEDGSVWFAGIPDRDDFQRLRDLLTDQGHRVRISADKAKNR